MNEIRNILLIGRTGSGKSTLGNVLINKNKNFEEVFRESDGSVSATKDVKEEIAEIDLNRDGSEKVRYRIIDTIGIGDTKLTPQGVLTKLAEMAGRVKSEGLNHILFVTQGRFTKEEVEAYGLLSSIIFDLDVLKYTTVVRTNFPRFENEEACANDRAQLRMENADLAHILNAVNIIYVDNPPLEGRQRVIEMNKETREESRKRLLTYLAGCRGNYRPSNIDTLNERVNEYKTNEQKLKAKMKEIEQARKQQEEEFRKKISELKEEQKRELRENRIKFEDDIRKVRVEGDEKLQKTRTEMEDKRHRDMADLENRNRQQISNLQAGHQRQAQSIREAGEQQMRTIQAQVQQSQQETERLRKELSEKSSSSNSDIAVLLAELKADDRKWEERRESQKWEYQEQRDKQDRDFRQQQSKLEEKRIEADKEIARQRLESENKSKDKESFYQSQIGSLKEKNKELKGKNQEQEEEIQYQKDNNTYQVQQAQKWNINRDRNWDKGLPRKK